MLIPGASSTKPAARILIIPNSQTHRHSHGHTCHSSRLKRDVYQLFFAVLVLVFTLEYSPRFLLLCFCRVFSTTLSLRIEFASSPKKELTRLSQSEQNVIVDHYSPRSRTILGGFGRELSSRGQKSCSTHLAFHTTRKKEKALHARASTAIDESRLIGRYCLKGLRRPLPCASEGPPPPCQKNSNTRSEMENGKPTHTRSRSIAC